MKYFITTDTHFAHEKMRASKWRRGHVKEEALWKNIENCVPPDATLIHLWDICMGSDREVHERIAKRPFKKILVRWNHDRNSLDWYMNHWRDFACDSFSINKYWRKFLFTHIPIIPLPPDTINIHGHFHDMNIQRCIECDFPGKTVADYTTKHVRLAPELDKYMPRNFDNVISFIFHPERLCELSKITSDIATVSINGHDFARDSIGTPSLFSISSLNERNESTTSSSSSSFSDLDCALTP